MRLPEDCLDLNLTWLRTSSGQRCGKGYTVQEEWIGPHLVVEGTLDESNVWASFPTS